MVKWDFFSWGTLWWDWGLPFPYFFFGQLETRSSNWPKSMFWIRSDSTMYLLRIRRVYRFLYKSHIHTDDPKLGRAQLFSMKLSKLFFLVYTPPPPPHPGNLGIDTGNCTFGKGDSRFQSCIQQKPSAGPCHQWNLRKSVDDCSKRSNCTYNASTRTISVDAPENTTGKKKL